MYCTHFCDIMLAPPCLPVVSDDFIFMRSLQDKKIAYQGETYVYCHLLITSAKNNLKIQLDNFQRYSISRKKTNCIYIKSWAENLSMEVPSALKVNRWNSKVFFSLS